MKTGIMKMKLAVSEARSREYHVPFSVWAKATTLAFIIVFVLTILKGLITQG